MAEVLAGLLTSAVLDIAKDKLASAIADKASLLSNFSDDLKYMNRKMESISAALQDAEKRSVNEKVVQLWLKRLKKAALDISDTLEDYQDTRKQLTAKVPSVLLCLPIGHKKINVASRMKSIREELEEINKEFQDFHFSNGGTTSIKQLDDDRETSSRMPNEPIVGRNREKKEIMSLLAAGTSNEETTLIVAIYGLGGMGKSTLAQQIYNDVHFKEYHRIWVYVSRDFSLRKIESSIISRQPIDAGQQNRDTLEVINQCLDDQLNGKKVLIVLDDLWEEKDTQLGKLRSMLQISKNKSMIYVIVTTRSEDIARKVSTNEPYKLQPLKVATCWEIIKRTSMFEQNHQQHGFEKIGRDIAKKCGGVALAAQAVGYLLRSKELSEWKDINNSDIWNEYSEDDVNVLPSLKLTYEKMPPQLKLCFSYCAIFKKGHNITEEDLIHQWIALDFIKPSMGKKYIRQLLGMSFLQVSKLPSTGGVTMAQYTMHDLVHDLATLIMDDELFTSEVASKSNNKQDDKYCRYALVTNFDQAQATKLSCILPSRVRALHFSDCNKLDLASGAISFAKCLRILDFSGCSAIHLPASIGKLKQLKYLLAPRVQNEVLPESITNLIKLQYLNLYGSCISVLPKSIGKLSGCLEFLGLSGCSRIPKLSESFCDLKCMMYLDMSGCSGIEELPGSLGNLTNLRHLELSECSRLKEIPESLCDLTQLQYLNLSGCRSIEGLPKAIGRLVDLQHLNLTRCGIRVLPESFKGLGNLLHLELVNSCIQTGLSGALHGLTALEHLNMSYYMYHAENLEKDDLPDAIRNLTYLKFLNLSKSLVEWFDVEKHDGYLDFIGALTNLECLKLSGNKSLKYLPESIGNLKRLHTLDLSHCSGLKFLPESISGATGLKSLNLDGCLNEVMDQASFILHYSLSLPLFKVRADDVNDCSSNLHQLQGESDIAELNLVSLENVRSLEEVRRLELSAKLSLVKLRLSWTLDADRHVDDNDLLRELMSPGPMISLEKIHLRGYSSPCFPSWPMTISHHLPALQWLFLEACPNLTILPEGIHRLSSLQVLWLFCCDNISALPERLSDTSSLKELRIMGCTGIKSLPQCMQQLTNLQKLVIFRNQELRQWCESEENEAKLAHIKNKYFT